MKLRKLEMLLEQVTGFEQPSPAMEQYQTPAILASRVLYTAFLAGDITGLRVLDLGSGTGTLAIGAALLGAGEVIGVEADAGAIRIATENAMKMKVQISFIQAFLRKNDDLSIIPPADTVIMNPPFGAQQEHADRPFIMAALEKADVVYGIFNAGSEPFIRKYIAGKGEITGVISAGCTIPRTFFFHTEDRREIPVEIIIMKRIQR
ncbi:MAG TPA: METTL5 family protein [Methanospirillum sp.]|nr:METTL5 family protein [Methanospirillum sp.]